MKKPPNTIILETLDRLNRALASDENAIFAAKFPHVGVTPEADYIELVAKIIKLGES